MRLLTIHLCTQKINNTVGKKACPYVSYVRSTGNYSRISCCLLRHQILTVEEVASCWQSIKLFSSALPPRTVSMSCTVKPFSLPSYWTVNRAQGILFVKVSFQFDTEIQKKARQKKLSGEGCILNFTFSSMTSFISCPPVRAEMIFAMRCKLLFSTRGWEAPWDFASPQNAHRLSLQSAAVHSALMTLVQFI